MDPNFEELRASCKFCCTLQQFILEKKKIKIDEEFILKFEKKLGDLVKYTLQHISYINQFHLDRWKDSCSAINILHKKLVKDNSNTILIDALEKLFLIFFQLLYQVEIDYLHFGEGVIRNEAETQNAKRYCSLMNRTENLDGCTKFGINSLVGKSSSNKYSCISLDGLMALCIQLFHFKLVNGIRFSNKMTFETVNLLIDACNTENLAVMKKVKDTLHTDKLDSLFQQRIIIFNRSKITSLLPQGCNASYKISFRDKVVILNIDILTYRLQYFIGKCY